MLNLDLDIVLEKNPEAIFGELDSKKLLEIVSVITLDKEMTEAMKKFEPMRLVNEE